MLFVLDFSREHMADDVRLWDGGLTIPKLAYCRAPHDVRSAGIAIIEVPIGGASQHAVASMKAAGAPFVITLGGDHDWELWRQSFDSVAKREHYGHAKLLPNYLEAYRSILNPDALYRAKLWGRVQPPEVQPELLDFSYLPLLEFELGNKVARLLEECFAHLATELGWSYDEDLAPRKAKWLVQAPFWLLAAKILKDKKVIGFRNVDLTDFAATFGKLAKHYQSRASEPTPVAVSKVQALPLLDVANRIARFHSLELMSTEALGHVYESAIINRETRKRWGTHSTPVWLIDYVMAKLRPLIADMPENKRRVFEPAVGHGGFLVSALRVLDELRTATNALSRKEYLRQRLSGVDIDDFSQEVARLALTLADVPNSNGWNLECRDMYEGDLLERRISAADIVLANPPFEDFSASAKPKGLLYNKAVEVFRQTMQYLPPGGIFGFVLPQAVLNSKEGEFARRQMLKTCDVHEITLFADKVFEFGEPESAIILGCKHPEKSFLTASRSLITYQRVRDQQIPVFKTTFQPSNSTKVPQSEFELKEGAELIAPLLPNVWRFLSFENGYRQLRDLARVGRGFSFKGKTDEDSGAGAVWDRPAKGRIAGYKSVNQARYSHQLPRMVWFDLSEDTVGTRRAGTITGIPQVLLNHARISRSEWKLRALIDRTGHAVMGRILVVRPSIADVTLETIWAILNSPIANAYAYGISAKRDVLLGDIAELPMPKDLSSERTEILDQYVVEYFRTAEKLDSTTETSSPDMMLDLFGAGNSGDRSAIQELKSRLMYLHWRIDAEVMKLYDLSAQLERQILDLFTGIVRPGVPFSQMEYFPPEFRDLERLDDLLAITACWNEVSERKSALIDLKLQGTAGEEELAELEYYKMLTEARGEFYAPLPLKKLEAVQHSWTSAEKS